MLFEKQRRSCCVHITAYGNIYLSVCQSISPCVSCMHLSLCVKQITVLAKFISPMSNRQ